MAILSSALNAKSADFEANHAKMDALVERLQGITANIAKGGGEKMWPATNPGASCSCEIESIY